MRQLETMLGEDAFRDGLREYLKRARVRQRDVAGPDRACSTRARPRISRRGAAPGSRSPAGRSIATELDDRRTAASRGWPSSSAIPSRRAASSGRSSCRSRSATPTASKLIAVALRRRARRRRRTRRAAGAALRPAERRRHRLRRLRPRSRERSRYLLDARCPTIGDPLTRGSAWVTLWDAMLDGDARARRVRRPGAARAAARDRRAERPAHPRLHAAAPTGGSCRRPSARGVAPRLEALLRDGLDAAPRRRA